MSLRFVILRILAALNITAAMLSLLVYAFVPDPNGPSALVTYIGVACVLLIFLANYARDRDRTWFLLMVPFVIMAGLASQGITSYLFTAAISTTVSIDIFREMKRVQS